MCGITGWISFRRDLTQERSRLDAMTSTMACRGPDAGGTWLDRNAALGHRRLAVIDLVGGVQPMSAHTPHGEVVLVYSGEVYNFTELREELIGEGAGRCRVALEGSALQCPFEGLHQPPPPLDEALVARWRTTARISHRRSLRLLLAATSTPRACRARYVAVSPALGEPAAAQAAEPLHAAPPGSATAEREVRPWRTPGAPRAELKARQPLTTATPSSGPGAAHDQGQPARHPA